MDHLILAKCGVRNLVAVMLGYCLLSLAAASQTNTEDKRPKADEYFLPGLASYGISPDGSWCAFVVREGRRDYIYTRSIRRNSAFKITGIEGTIDQLSWVNSNQFAYRTLNNGVYGIFFSDYSGKYAYNILPDKVQFATIVPDQPPCAASGKFFFEIVFPGTSIRQIVSIKIPDDSAVEDFSLKSELFNTLGIESWIFTRSGQVVGGVATQGAEKALFISTDRTSNEQGLWVKLFAAMGNDCPQFTGLGAAPGKLNAIGYFGGEYSSIREFDLKKGSFGEIALKSTGSNIRSTIFSPDGTRLDVVQSFARDGRVEFVSRKAQEMDRAIVDLVGHAPYQPLAFASDYSSALIVRQGMNTAPKYWFVDTKQNVAFDIYDIGKLIPKAYLGSGKRIDIVARDGLRLPCFELRGKLMRGSGTTFILIPGGPFAGVYPDWSPIAQYLSSLGNRVVICNYRGSRGYGSSFYRAGLGEVDSGMVNDVADIVGSVARSNKTSRIVLVGFSLGGYLALRAEEQKLSQITATVLVNPLLNIPAFFKVRENQVPKEEFDYQKWLWFGSESDLKSKIVRATGHTILIQGQSDNVTPYADAEEFTAMASTQGYDVKRIMIDDGHEIENLSSWLTICEALIGVGKSDESVSHDKKH